LGDRFAAAVASGSIDAVLDCYANDARVMFPGQGEEARGKAELRRLLERSIADMKAQPIEQKSADTIAIDADHLLNVGRWELRTTGPDGKPLVMTVRTTEVLVKEGTTWRYFIDHASVGLPPPPPPPAAPRRSTKRR
jgi:ketosteroid isomerase-like protein